jgi:hypothetical protein
MNNDDDWENKECEVCEKKVKDSEGSEGFIHFLAVTGFTKEGAQYGLTVCLDCFNHKPEAVLQKLKDFKDLFG